MLSIEWGIGISLLVPDESCQARTAARRAAILRCKIVKAKVSLPGYAEAARPMHARNVGVWQLLLRGKTKREQSDGIASALREQREQGARPMAYGFRSASQRG
jgi:hypothetical protein